MRLWFHVPNAGYRGDLLVSEALDIVRLAVHAMQVTLLLFKTPEFEEWFDSQALRTQIVVEARLSRLADYGHWGFVNRFEGLVELKWPTGIRVYTAEIRKVKVIVLLGGNKNAQSKDIKKAKELLKKYSQLL